MRMGLMPRCAIALALVLTGWHTYAAADLNAQYRLNVPPLPVFEALKQFAAQTNLQIVYYSEVAEGIASPGAVGQLTAGEALNRILGGTGLAFQFLNDRTIAIRRVANAAPPLSAYETTVSEGTTEEARGWFRRLRLAQNGQTSRTNSSSSEQQNTRENSSENSQKRIALEEVVVTGTNLRGIAPESSPVLVLTRQDIEASGQTTVEQFLRNVPQNFQAGANQENFNVTFAGADVTEQGAGVNLRGLGQRATLVLLNGRRLAPSGFAGSYVDISLIPISAVERIELLTDGASAIYGSDAVGGVVNFILRDNFVGMETSLHLGTGTRGDGDQVYLSQALGDNWNRGHGLLVYEYRSEDAVLAADRDFTIGIPPASFFLPQERRHSAYASVEQNLTDRLTVDLSGSYSTRVTKRDFIPTGSPLPVAADADSAFYSVSAQAAYDLGRSWWLEATAAFSNNDADSSQFQSGGTGIINDGTFTNELREAGAKINGDLYALPAGALKLAAGAQYRHENHASNFVTASQIMAGLPPSIRTIDRSSRALFAEVLIPFFSSANAITGVQRLEISAAARYEDYGDFGATTDPKFGLLWSPVPGLALRATYGTSFHAPLLSEALGTYNVFYWPDTASLYATSDDPAMGTGVPLRLIGSNPDLDPETSETWTAGLTLRPEGWRGLTVTVDYFSTEFSDRIATPTPTIAGVIGNPAFASIIIRDPSLDLINSILAGAGSVRDFSGPGFTNGGATPTDVSLIIDNRTANTAVTTTSGIDVRFDYSFPLGVHRLGFQANSTYLFSFDDQLTATSPAIHALNNPYRPIDLRVHAGASWVHGGWSGKLSVNRIDDYTDARVAPVRRVDSFTTVDLTLAYSFERTSLPLLDGTRIALSALNLFETDPPALALDPGAVRGLGYDPVNASGRGRFVGLQLRKSW